MKLLSTLAFALVLLGGAAQAETISPEETQKQFARLHQEGQSSVALHDAAGKGDPKAQYEYGQMRATGSGLPVLTTEEAQTADLAKIKAQDPEEAMRWFEKSAAQSYAPAQLELGKMLMRKGPHQDKAAALDWIRKAAEQDLVEAQFLLGLIYDPQSNLGVPADPAQSVKWFRKAAEQGHRDAQFYMGLAVFNGAGIAADSRQAMEWFEKAALQGDVRAEQNMAVMLTTGAGSTAEDKRRGLEWLRKAAEHGSAQAQLDIGYRYYVGMDLEQNKALGEEWLRKSAAQGNVKAKSILAAQPDSR